MPLAEMSARHSTRPMRSCGLLAIPARCAALVREQVHPPVLRPSTERFRSRHRRRFVRIQGLLVHPAILSLSKRPSLRTRAPGSRRRCIRVRLNHLEHLFERFGCGAPGTPTALRGCGTPHSLKIASIVSRFASESNRANAWKPLPFGTAISNPGRTMSGGRPCGHARELRAGPSGCVPCLRSCGR